MIDLHDNEIRYKNKVRISRAEELTQVKAYVFGDRFQCLEFRKAVYETFLRSNVEHKSPPYFQTITYALNNLPAKDLLLKVLIDTHCAFYKPKYEDEVEIQHRDDIPREFLTRTMLRYSNGIFHVPTRAEYPFVDKAVGGDGQ